MFKFLNPIWLGDLQKVNIVLLCTLFPTDLKWVQFFFLVYLFIYLFQPFTIFYCNERTFEIVVMGRMVSGASMMQVHPVGS